MGVQLRRSVETQLFPSWHKITTDKMEANLSATFDAGNSFNSKLKDTLEGLLGANNERKAEIASIFDQNHKDNHKNSMAGQNIIMDVKRGDEIVVYAYTGTWLADFPMNHYTHWVGLLLKPSEEEIDALQKASQEL